MFVKNLFSFWVTAFAFMFARSVVPDDVKAQIDQGFKDHTKAVDDVKKAQADIDGKLADMKKSIEDGQVDAVDKESFQQYVAKAEKAENAVADIAKKLEAGNFGGGKREKTFADLIGEAKASEQWQKSGGRSAKIADWNGSLFAKDITSGADSAGSLIEAQRRPGIIYEPEQPLTIRDLFMMLPTSSNAIEWVQEKLFTNNAAPQGAEGTALAKSELTFEQKTTAVQTLGHWFAVSEQVLSDAVALRAHIEKRGVYGLKLKEEAQLLLGDGTGSNLLGVMPQATAYNSALSKSGDKKLDQLRRSILQVNNAGYPADGFVLNPADWCDIELSKTDDNAYLFANPVNGTQTRLWGKRVVEGLAMTEGEFLTGAFMSAATIYDRQQVSVDASDSHAEFFVENMVAIRIRERLALTVDRPAALIKGTLADTA